MITFRINSLLKVILKIFVIDYRDNISTGSSSPDAQGEDKVIQDVLARVQSKLHNINNSMKSVNKNMNTRLNNLQDTVVCVNDYLRMSKH